VLDLLRPGDLVWIGFILPILWIIGALIAPTECAAARASDT
jgi:hypothetical protein